MTGWRRSDLVLAGIVLFSLVLFLVPQIVFIRLSFFRYLGMGQVGDFAGMANYVNAITDRFTLVVMGRTVVLSLLAAVVSLIIAVPAAYWLTRLKSRWRGTLIVLLLISSFVSVVVKVLGLQILLGSNGVIVSAIRFISFEAFSPQLLNNNIGVAIGLTQYTLPLMLLILFGVFQNIPAALEEAALIHGATDSRMFRRVLLPEAASGMTVAFLMAFNMNMGAFTSAALLGGGMVLTVPLLIQRLITLDLNYPAAAALSVLLTLTVIFINILAGVLTRRRRRAGAER